MPRVRGPRIASSTASSSRYGVPGTTHTPSASAADSASGLGSQRASTAAGMSASVASISRWVRYSEVAVAKDGDRDGMKRHDSGGQRRMRFQYVPCPQRRNACSAERDVWTRKS